jgi:DNA-binding transcriptional LysR family regulator
MDTRHLRYFVAVAEERHFGRAAARLHMAQPPLSQQIKQFEDQLGTQLLVRTTRKVDLTPAGELLLARARVLLAEIDQLAQDVRLVGEGASGVLRIGVSGSATYSMMPRLIEAARQRLPGLKLNVKGEMLTPEMEEALEENRIDVAVLRPPVRSEALELKFLEQDELVVAVPAGHRFAPREFLDIRELAGEPQVQYPPSSAVNNIVVEACRRAGFTPLGVQEARETSTLLSFVSAGMGVALVPGVQRMFALDGIVFVPLRDAPAADLAVAWRRGNDTSLVRNLLNLFDAPVSPEGTPE